MVWSKQDFAREVRRQLIELESIRKRAPADAELHERIDRLEESHLHVLRKLAERPAGSGTKVKKARPPMALRERASPDGKALERRAKRLLAAEIGWPHPAERCASCGRVLLLSLFAGGQVVFHKAAWYHRDCMQACEGLN